MIVKIFKNRGKGSPKASIDYLLGKDRDRELAKLLSGNPDLSQYLAESLTFKNKYTVGCLSFEESDLPKDAKKALMQKFESMCFASLSREQYDITWIEHRDKGRLELNFFIPNVELTTGKRYQSYFHRKDKTYFDSWINLQNHEYGLSDPHAPEKQQLAKFEFKADSNRNQIKEQITQAVLEGIQSQSITSRDDVITLLKNSGFSIARTTSKSISITHSELSKNIRLSGVIYEDRQFSADFAAEFEQQAKDYRSNTRDRISAAQATFDEGFRRRAEFNHRKYRKNPKDTHPTNNLDHAAMPRVTNNLDTQSVLSEISDRPNQAGNLSPATNRREDESPSIIASENRSEPDSVSAINKQEKGESLPSRRWHTSFRDLQKIGDSYAKRIQQRLGRILNAVRETLSHATERKRAIAASEQHIEQTQRRVTTSERNLVETKRTIEAAISRKNLNNKQHRGISR